MTKQPTKRTHEDAMSTVDLKAKIDATGDALRKALVAGDRTDKLRTYLHELEAEQQKLDDAAATQEAAEQAAVQDRKQAERQRIEDAARILFEARKNRIAALATRFTLVPASRA